MNFFRPFLAANVVLLFAFACLPILILKPDMDLFQNMLQFINKE